MPSNAAPACPPGAVVTKHQAMLAGEATDYVACVGTLPVTNGAGAKGQLFYTAYLREGAKRPLAFIWNGGPGGDSRLLHFHALGPVLIRGGSYQANVDSPLAVADLVFVDPVGTSFSRGATEADAKKFYGTVADIAATADFIEGYRRATKREAAPLFLIGESFGTWRAAGAAEKLVEHGVPVAGMVLVSGGIPLGDMPDRNRTRALTLPNRTATAFALGKLPAELEKSRAAALLQSQDFADQVYAPALADPTALDAGKREEVALELARLQGLDPKLIDRTTLWVSPRDFRKGLLASEGKTLDIFDMRKTAPSVDAAADEKLALEWFRKRLGYVGGSYAGIESAALPVGENWAYDQSPITRESLARAMAGEGPPSASRPWTLTAMQKAPKLRTFVATGIYDSLNGCASNLVTVAALPPEVAERFTMRCYEGGHMMYEEPGTDVVFNSDIAAFLSGGKRE
ncbi:S10 family serine carboxypeptidase-like protein [Sandaracinobacteroides hominis]|uniref:S10 family serine carboxypeptidase-like protein n=1 Tax=Sandaracinobacteroides hominis TaxID=2780086 RepID=UPI0018F3547A|nr:peptidase S10 [Sandaracinobacteroides hominis]